MPQQKRSVGEQHQGKCPGADHQRKRDAKDFRHCVGNRLLAAVAEIFEGKKKRLSFSQGVKDLNHRPFLITFIAER